MIGVVPLDQRYSIDTSYIQNSNQMLQEKKYIGLGSYNGGSFSCSVDK